MNFLKTKTEWSNIELGILKLCLISTGVIIGLYFYEFLQEYLFVFWAIFAVATTWSVYLWIKKMKSSKRP